MNHAAKCIHLQLVEPIPVIHLVTEQLTGEYNVIDIHPCSRLVQRKTLNYKCHYSAYSLQLPLLDSNETGGLIGMNIIWSHFIVQ